MSDPIIILKASDLTLLEQMKTAGATDAAVANARKAFTFATVHDLTCTGNPKGTKPCDGTPVKMMVLHGRPIAMQCVRCLAITTRVAMYMGHGSCRHDGLEHYPVLNLKLWADKWRALVAKDGFVVPKGRHWTQTGQTKGESELDKLMNPSGIILDA